MEPLLVPIKSRDEKGNEQTKYEPWNQGGIQSDGSQYFEEQLLTEENHEHYFELRKPTDRHVMCQCGHGGLFFPHTADIKDGHIYTKDGRKVI